jgi:putative Mn2+ efflux pump MntP
MREIIKIYKQNRVAIEKYLSASLTNKGMGELEPNRIRECFQLFQALDLVYMVSGKFRQITPFYFRRKVETTTKGLDREYMFGKIQFADNDLYISQAYISSHSGEPSLTAVKKINGEYVVLDFSLIKLLEELRLIENNRFFNHLSKAVYSMIGLSLIIFAIFLTGYALFTFFYSFTDPASVDMHATFRSIIALTLGLAIFDLSRTILEQEVFYKSYTIEPSEENRLLIRFLTSIIIALSIEALMVVFKIALVDYKEMSNAIYLIGGVSAMIVALGLFSYLTKERGKQQ